MAFAQRLALKVVLAGSTEVVVTTDARREALHRRRKRRGVHVVPVFPTIPVAASAANNSGLFVIGVPGYAGDGVRPDVLVEALALLDGGRSLRTVLLGAPGADSEHGRRWRRLADQHQVTGMDFTGVVGAPELSRHFASCNVVVLVNEEGPSARKTTLATSLAHGLPVVSLDGYNRWGELVAAGAVRVVPADPQILAGTLAELRDSPATRAALAERGRAFAEDHMSVQAAANTFACLLEGRSPPQDGR
jgi:glycosyltransferase involved in cell wall biosynthesis